MGDTESTLLITADDQKKIISKDYRDALKIVEAALYHKASGAVLMPDKISTVFDEATQNRINCLPCALLDENVYGIKWVAVFPENPKHGYRNVTGTIVLSELKYGHTLSVMDAGYLTDIRTASVGATAAKYLSKEDSVSIGFIGAGQQARRHLDLIKIVRPGLKYCYVSSRTEQTVNDFIQEEKALHPDIEFIPCGSDYEKAVRNSDIIVTAISGQECILKAAWISKGALYIHVGGLEDEYAVPLSASKIICDDWECVKHRTQTISRMYKEGLLRDSDIYGNLDEIVTRKKVGRTYDEFIYFCSVGLACIDISFAEYIYKKCKAMGCGVPFKFS